MPELPPQYNPKGVEERLYQQWESVGYFHVEPKIGDSPLGDSQLRGGSGYFYGLTCWVS